MGRYLRSCILLLTGVMRGWWRACLRARGTRRQQESLGSHPSLVKVRRVVRLLLNHIGPQELEEMDTKGGTALQRAAQGCSFWARGTGRQECGVMPLMEAAAAGHLGAVQVLVQHLGPHRLAHTGVRHYTWL